ncbi:hypothetical protein Dimus_001103 [Dionaea muscipula]
MNQQVDELLARPFVSDAGDKEWEDNRDYGGQGNAAEMPQMDKVEGSKREGRVDVGPSSLKRQERSLFAPRRLRLPSTNTMRNCWDSLMGAASHTTIRSMRGLPLKHKCAILCRNMAESTLLTVDVIFSSFRTDARRCRKIDKLKEEKYALERKVKELKVELDSSFEISSEIKADVDMVMEKNKTLEEKNEELEKKIEEMKSTLEEEKKKGQTLEKKVKELQAALQKEKEKCGLKEDELIGAYKKHQELLH